MKVINPSKIYEITRIKFLDEKLNTMWYNTICNFVI
jgi:hypothetical protein